MPTPNKNETKSEFIERFMSSAEAVADYPSTEQRYAVANSTWENHISKKTKL